MASGRTARRTNATIADLGEFGLIDRIRRVLRGSANGVVLGIGDDTAALDMGGPRLLLATVDMQVEGRHFLRARTPPELLGRRVAAVNLSDIAAMGGVPRWALVSLALPSSLPAAWVDRFYEGLDAILDEHGAFVVGGNLSGGRRIVADLTLLGEVERIHLLTRAGARPGDLLCVTGTLGRSAAGRAVLDAAPAGRVAERRRTPAEPIPAAGAGTAARFAGAVRAHLAPVPRVREGHALAAASGVTAMLDLSDGLASDLGHICDASNVGVALQTALLPLAEDTCAIATTLALDPVALALFGGEDFELLFTAAPDAIDRLRAAVIEVAGTPVTVIGEVLPADEGRRLIDAAGETWPLAAAGWDHFRRDESGGKRG